jgi:hypothetical protein
MPDNEYYAQIDRLRREAQKKPGVSPPTGYRPDGDQPHRELSPEARARLEEKEEARVAAGHETRRREQAGSEASQRSKAVFSDDLQRTAEMVEERGKVPFKEEEISRNPYFAGATAAAVTANFVQDSLAKRLHRLAKEQNVELPGDLSTEEGIRQAVDRAFMASGLPGLYKTLGAKGGALLATASQEVIQDNPSLPDEVVAKLAAMTQNSPSPE